MSLLVSDQSVRAQQGMTLFEVAMALLIMAIVVTTAVAVFPTGLKGQQLVRGEILAVAAFQNMLDRLGTPRPETWGSEGRAADDRPWMNARVWAADADGMLLTAGDTGFKPIPDQVAWRFDSDDNEIARHLQDGGKLFYLNHDNAWRNYVFAMVGAPQQEVMRVLPQMRWPYYDYLSVRYLRGGADANRPREQLFGGPMGSNAIEGEYWSKRGIGFDGAVIRQFADLDPVAYGDAFYLDATHDDEGIRLWSTRPAHERRIDRAQWVAGGGDGAEWDEAIIGGNWDGYLDWQEWARFRLERALIALLEPDPGARDPAVLAVFMANPPDVVTIATAYQADPLRTVVMANVLRYYTFVSGILSLEASRSTSMVGRAIPDPNPAIRQHQQAHELALRYNRYLQLHQPADLRTVRDITHGLMSDHLLLQHDVFGIPLAEAGVGSAISHAWDYLVAEPLHAHRSESHSLPKTADEVYTIPVSATGAAATTWTPKPNQTIHPGISAGVETMHVALQTNGPGDVHQRWNLTNRFAASERCRQFVAWQVDWQNYEDAERVPGASHEAAQLAVQMHDNRGVFDWTNARRQVMGGWATFHPDSRASFEVMGWLADKRSRNVTYKYATHPWIDLSRYFALYGADRNLNEREDPGMIPPDHRMRAILVGRFDFYDPRAQVPMP